MTISRAHMKDQSFSPTYKLICYTNIKMKLKWNFASTGQGCQLAAWSLKLYAPAKLRSIDSCQNGTHYQITNNVGSNTRSARLKCLTSTRSQQSVYSKIRHSNEVQSIVSCQTTASADHHHLTVSRAQVSTHLIRSFLKLSADKLLLFKWLQAKVHFFNA